MNDPTTPAAPPEHGIDISWTFESIDCECGHPAVRDSTVALEQHLREQFGAEALRQFAHKLEATTSGDLVEPVAHMARVLAQQLADGADPFGTGGDDREAVMERMTAMTALHGAADVTIEQMREHLTIRRTDDPRYYRPTP